MKNPRAKNKVHGTIALTIALVYILCKLIKFINVNDNLSNKKMK